MEVILNHMLYRLQGFVVLHIEALLATAMYRDKSAASCCSTLIMSVLLTLGLLLKVILAVGLLVYARAVRPIFCSLESS